MNLLSPEQIEQLKRFLQDQQPQMIDLLRRLVQAESPSSVPETQEPRSSYLI